MQTARAIFDFRWVLQVSGILFLTVAIGQGLTHSSLRLFIGSRESWQGWIERARRVADRRFNQALGMIVLTFIALGWLSKFSQLITFRLNSFDFWLFEDLLHNLGQGQFFLTRFAPQSLGMVQHGVVHSTWTWALGVPLSYILGTIQAALLYGPLSLGLAGLLLGWIVRPRLGPLPALLFTGAFLVNSPVAKILNYDVHPEVAYPLTVFLWAWSIGLGDGKVRLPALVFATLAGIGVKEDSFLVYTPWFLWAWISLPGVQRKAAGLSFGIAVSFYAFTMLAMSQWSSQQWGAKTWEGLSVVIPPGADLIKGVHWSSPYSIAHVTQLLVADAGGVTGLLLKTFHFWTSRPWLSLLILCPWVLLDLSFFWVVGPLSIAYSLLGRAAILNLYYSAPFLGSLWLCSALGERVRRAPLQLGGYALITSCLLGGNSIQLFVPSVESLEFAREAKALVDLMPGGSRGLVQTPLIPYVPREQILSERIPTQWETYDFVFLAPSLSSFEMPSANQKELVRQLQNSEGVFLGWCEAKVPRALPEDHVRLFFRRGLPCPS